MKIRNILAATTIATVSTMSHAGSDGWTTIGNTDGMRWDVQNGSFRFMTVRSGDAVAAVNGRVFTASTKRIDVYQWYVKVNDCVNRIGGMVTLNARGEFVFENDFTFGAGSIASTIAELICGVAQDQAKKASDKSL